MLLINIMELCEWYDGYLFGNTEIFNPWSVIGYFNNNCRPKAFWQSTGSNDIIREVLASATPDIMERLELLMKGRILRYAHRHWRHLSADSE